MWASLPGGSLDRKKEPFALQPRRLRDFLVHVFCQSSGLDAVACSQSGRSPLSLMLLHLAPASFGGNRIAPFMGFKTDSNGGGWENSVAVSQTLQELLHLWQCLKQAPATRLSTSSSSVGSGGSVGSAGAIAWPVVDLLQCRDRHKTLLAQQIVAAFGPVFQPTMVTSGASAADVSTSSSGAHAQQQPPPPQLRYASPDIITSLREIYSAARDQLAAVETSLQYAATLLPPSYSGSATGDDPHSSPADCFGPQASCVLSPGMDRRWLTSLVALENVGRISTLVAAQRQGPSSSAKASSGAGAASSSGVPKQRRLLALLLHECLHPLHSPSQLQQHPVNAVFRTWCDGGTIALANQLGDVRGIAAVLASRAASVKGDESLISVAHWAIVATSISPTASRDPASNAVLPPLELLRLAVSALARFYDSPPANSPTSTGGNSLIVTLTRLLMRLLCKTAAAVRLLVDAGADVDLGCCRRSSSEQDLTPLEVACRAMCHHVGSSAVTVDALVGVGADIGPLVAKFLKLPPSPAVEYNFSDQEQLLLPQFQHALHEAVWARRKHAVAAREGGAAEYTT